MPAKRYLPWENIQGRKVYFLLPKNPSTTGEIKKKNIHTHSTVIITYQWPVLEKIDKSRDTMAADHI